MNNIPEKISLTLILLKIFHIYLCHYFATNNKIAITHLWHAMELQTICHLIVKDKVAEQHILGKYCNCNFQLSVFKITFHDPEDPDGDLDHSQN